MLLLADEVLSFCFPVDYTYQTYSVAWHFFFIGLMVFVNDKPLLTRLLICMLGGMILDLFFAGTFPVNLLLFVFFGGILGFFYPWMDRTKAAFLIYLISCFLFDAIPWFFGSLFGFSSIEFGKWFLFFELPSLIFDAIVIIIIMYIDIVMVRFFLIVAHRERKEKRRAAGKAAKKTAQKAVRTSG